MKNRSIGAYMTRNPYSIGSDQTLTQAHELMRARGVRHLPVLSAGKLVGLVSQRDLSLIEALSDVDPARVPIEDAMSQLPYTASPGDLLASVAAIMAREIRRRGGDGKRSRGRHLHHGRRASRPRRAVGRTAHHQAATTRRLSTRGTTMRTIDKYMTLAPTAVMPDTPLGEARELMRQSGVHHLPVLLGKRLVGLVTESDLFAFEDVPEIQRHRFRVEDVMVPLPLSVQMTQPLVDVAREMLRGRSSAAVVSHRGEVVGVFTLTDALRALVEVLDGGPPLGRRMPAQSPHTVGR